MDNNDITYSGELTHWGIRGMRWGIRRYQNKDGSLTDAGKKKLRAEQAKVREQEQVNKNRKATNAKFERLAARKKAAADEKKALDEAAKNKNGKGKKSGDSDKNDKNNKSDDGKKSIKDMTDAELKNAIERARLEDTYRQLRPEPEKGAFMKKMVDDVAVPALVSAGKNTLTNVLNKAGEMALEKALGKAVDPNSLEALNRIRDKAKAKYEALDYEKKMEKLNNPGKDNGLPEIKTWDDVIKSLDYKSKTSTSNSSAQQTNTKPNAKSESNSKPKSDTSATSGSSTRKSVIDAVLGAGAKGSSRNKTSATLNQDDYDFSPTLKAKGNLRNKKSVTLSQDDYDFSSGSKSSSSSTTGLGQRTVFGLLSSGSSSSRQALPSGNSPAVALGQRTIAGLLPAPKDDD